MKSPRSKAGAFSSGGGPLATAFNPVDQIADAPSLALSADLDAGRRLAATSHPTPLGNRNADKFASVSRLQDTMSFNFRG
jgi:hypothetical protein